MSSPQPLTLHADRLLPGDPQTRQVARRIYQAVRDQPILSPHGHVDPNLLLADVQFPDPSSLLISPDHYVTRLLHASGVPLAALGVGRGPQKLSSAEARAAWRLLCERWDVLLGTTVRLWLEAQLVELFGVSLRPSRSTADDLFDQVAARLAEPAFRPRALFARFGIEVLATTDDPTDDLSAHAALSEDSSWTGRVIPTFRPDRYLEVGAETWVEDVARLGDVAGVDTGTFAGWVDSMEVRRAFFAAHGARSTDHSHEDVWTTPLDMADAARIYDAALRGKASALEAVALRRHMLLEMARMATEDGLTMTLHPGVRRNHHGPTRRAFGPDTGHDIPLRTEFTDPLRPLLERFGTHPNLTLVLFTTDETVFSRELAPLAGFYPSVYIGAPWWFLDSPAAVRRWRGAVTDIAGLSRTSGFVDDTRAFCSIPARHDMSRRLDSGFLAELVVEHRMSEDDAVRAALDLVVEQPRKVFGL